MSLTLYYASDIHGSDRLWRKFVNAGRFYGADVLVMGGDLAGKAVAAPEHARQIPDPLMQSREPRRLVINRNDDR